MAKESKSMRFIVALVSVLGLLLTPALASAAEEFGFAEFSAATTQNGEMSRQAGAHADFTTTVRFTTVQDYPVEDVHTVDVDLPPGITGDPTATPTCTFAELVAGDNGKSARCPIDAQVGIANVFLPGGGSDPRPVYNMEAPDDLAGLFAFNYTGVIVRIEPRVRATDYGISARVAQISHGLVINGSKITLWGVPSDPSHFDQRYDPDKIIPGIGGWGASSRASRRPFMTNPTSCTSAPSVFSARAFSWQNQGAFKAAPSTDRDADGTPFIWEGCEQLRFEPSIDVQPGSHMADAPSGLNVDLTLPQSESAGGLATAHVKNVKVTLPEGMSVSPSSAAGLGACGPGDIKLGSNEEPTCPASSRIGTVEIDTPLLDEPLTGDVILAQQNQNPFGTMLAMYLVARGPGVMVKLPGRIDTDPNTGRVVTTFDNNPQLPFSALRLSLRGGPKAPLATPPACGRYTTRASITSWASDKSVELETPMVIDEGCGPRSAAPAFAAGTTSPLAGGDSPFTFSLTRGDRTQYLSRIDAQLPPGLLGRIATVPRCANALANAGLCPPASLIGSTDILSGPGETPLPMKGRVYLTERHGSAPFGLSIVVTTAGQAGPFDLGNVVVRAGISVNRTDASVSVRSDPLPRIIQGIPLRLRQVVLNIDRAGFMVNPTSCDPMRIGTTVETIEGASWATTVPFRAGGCRDLNLDQKLEMRLTGRKATTDGTHPGISATLTSGAGNANLENVAVKLPLSLALDADNAQGLCKPEQRERLACPRESIIGRASAKSILPSELTGPVYFVEGIRFSKTGRRIRTLPKLWIPLSADGVTIDVNADSDVDSIDRLVTTFRNLPDAPITEFKLNLVGGSNGVIAVSGKPSACKRSRTADVQMVGHNGTTVEDPVKLSIDGCKPRIAKTSVSKTAVSVRVGDIGPGKLTVRGSGVATRSRTVKKAGEATVTAPLTSGARTALRRNGTAVVRLMVTYQPKRGAAVRLTETVRVRR
jgi:hypothetical protein